mmetsp:Transcript_4049/g.7243  ORF Transcript_4049/g.7243 Transcript_4049/m.7243 type:complete len:232 (+) Transcript_4049:55-750(+)
MVILSSSLLVGMIMTMVSTVARHMCLSAMGTHGRRKPSFYRDGAAGDSFGYAVALDGDTIFITSPFDSDNGIDSGSAYIFSTPLSDLVQSKSPSSSSAPSPISPPPTTYCIDVDVGINVFTNNWQDETSWTLSRINSSNVMETFFKGSAEFVKNLHSYADKMCLERGEYEFTIYDSKGDGICCGVFGNGYYNMTVDGKVIAQGGEFERKETTSFSIPINMNQTLTSRTLHL